MNQYTPQKPSIDIHGTHRQAFINGVSFAQLTEKLGKPEIDDTTVGHTEDGEPIDVQDYMWTIEQDGVVATVYTYKGSHDLRIGGHNALAVGVIMNLFPEALIQKGGV